MNDPKRVFRHESLQEADVLADHLVGIAEALRTGELHLADDGGEMTLAPGGLVRFELTGYQRDGEGSVRISLAWRPSDERSSSTLRISTRADDQSAGS